MRRSRGLHLLVGVALLSCAEPASPPPLPNPPDGVNVSLSGKSRVVVAWTARPEVESIVSYSVYRDGIDIAQTALTSFTDSTAAESATHEYAVTSRSSTGLVSQPSPPKTIFVPDASKPFVVDFSPKSGILPMGVWPSLRFSERLKTNFFGDAPGVRLIDYVGSPNPIMDTAPFDTSTNVATLRPFKRVQSFHPYTVEVTNGALDLAGNSIEPFQFTVQFGEWTLPAITSVIPAEGATNVPRSTGLVIDLAAPVLPVNDYEPRIDIRRTGTSESPLVFHIYVMYSPRITAALSTLEANTEYTAVFYHFFTDSNGVRRELTKQWTFTTGN